jgi:excisionase family DNA binding protein
MAHRRCECLRSVPKANGHRPTRSDATLVYTVAEVAERLKVSPGTVRNMIDQGQLYALRLHQRRIVIPRWALEDLLARPESSVTALRKPASNA